MSSRQWVRIEYGIRDHLNVGVRENKNLLFCNKIINHKFLNLFNLSKHQSTKVQCWDYATQGTFSHKHANSVPIPLFLVADFCSIFVQHLLNISSLFFITYIRNNQSHDTAKPLKPVLMCFRLRFERFCGR